MASAQAVQATTNNAVLTNAPPVNAVLEESTLAPLRSVQHKDVYGNVISGFHSSQRYLIRIDADLHLADPDLSNPTRPRLERPLDTIRSFEKAIDNGYKRRSSYVRSGAYRLHYQCHRQTRKRAFGLIISQNPSPTCTTTTTGGTADMVSFRIPAPTRPLPTAWL
jgi:hypothetical protein